jgi:hypothetical protein
MPPATEPGADGCWGQGALSEAKETPLGDDSTTN